MRIPRSAPVGGRLKKRARRQRHLSIFLVVLAAVACGPDGPKPGAGVAEFVGHVEQRVPMWMGAYGIPGASLALIVDGEPVWSMAFGYADPRQDRAMELDAVYRVESLSKPVTAWGVMRLEEEDLVELDGAVEAQFSEFRLPPSEFDTRQVTVRRLLSGTSGLPLGTLGMEYTPGEPLARFVAAGMYGRSDRGGRVLEEASVHRLHAAEATGLGIYGVVADGYGLGHFVEELPSGESAVFHGGQGNGWMTHMHWVPATGEGIVILTNSQRSWPFMARILGDWARWRDLPTVGMTRITLAARLVGALVGILLAGAVWQILRLGLDLRVGRRRLAPLRREGRLLRAVQLGVAGALIGLVGWAVQAEYLFLASVVPHLMGWFAAALVVVALVLAASAFLPKPGALPPSSRSLESDLL